MAAALATERACSDVDLAAEELGGVLMGSHEELNSVPEMMSKIQFNSEM